MILYQVYKEPAQQQNNRTWKLDEPSKCVAEYQEMIKEYILLVVTNTFKEDEDKELLIKRVNDLCIQRGAHSRQRVLLIDQEDVVEQLKPGLNAAIALTSPEDSIETVRAFTVSPGSGAVVGLVKDKLSRIDVELAFLDVIDELEKINLPADFPTV